MVDIGNYPTKVAEMMGMKEEADSMEDDALPAYARVQIPLRSKTDLDRAADVLIDLAHRLRLEARNTNTKQRQALRNAWWDIRSANSGMQRYTKSGE